jgi:mRNA-degrading endonuclease RelE of RelBE toxin-antitoxin system
VTYRIVLTSTATRQIANLPASAAWACHEFISGALVANPHRVGAPLHAPFEGQWRARRGEYRIRYTIDDEERVVTVVDASHRRDAYRTR